MVQALECKSQLPTPTGGNFSDLKVSSLSTGRTIRYLMSMVVKMRKVDQPKSGPNMVELTRDGRFFILISNQRFQPKDSIKNSDSTSTDHSTSDQDFQ